METQRKQIVKVLEEKGIEYSETTLHGEKTSVEWSSRKSSYRLGFDSRGAVECAEIDGDRMFQMAPFYDQRHERRKWFVDGFSGAGMRFHTLEKFLGIDLFE